VDGAVTYQGVAEAFGIDHEPLARHIQAPRQA